MKAKVAFYFLILCQQLLSLERFGKKVSKLKSIAELGRFTVHDKKRLATFQSPAGMSLTKLSMAGNNLIIPAQGEFGK
jgi:hypothetical protein